MQLVELKKGDIFCDSNLVAKKFGIKHNKVVRTIENLATDLEELRGTQCTPKLMTEEREYRGRKFTSYLLSREFFSLLAMRFKGKKALEWQVKFNSAFYDMEKRILLDENNKQNSQWVTSRNQGKQIRLETTDIIKEFVEYATKQGSQKARFYYKHITTATYKALGLIQYKQPQLRDTLNILELGFLQSAEFVAQRSLRKHMESGEHYKAIFVLVKQDLEVFANGLLLN